MLKKTIRRLGALAMILAMAVSVFAVNASATGAEANIQFEKSLVVSGDSNAELPLDETFNFTVTDAGESTDTTYDNPGAAAITVSTVTFAKGATTSTKNIDVTVNKDYFKLYASDTDNSKVIGYKVGTYYYTIAETAGSTDGMSYSTATKKLAVQVLADGTCNYYVVANGSDVKDDAKFENKYTAHKLTVTKKVTGNQGDKNKGFVIYVTINGDASETYKTSKGTTIASGETVGIVLKSGESMEFYNLSAGDTYTVVENDAYEAEGYEVTGNVTTETAIGNSDAEVTIENKKNVNPPTGVITTIAPYALMVVLAGAFAVVFLTRRNRAE